VANRISAVGQISVKKYENFGIGLKNDIGRSRLRYSFICQGT